MTATDWPEDVPLGWLVVFDCVGVPVVPGVELVLPVAVLGPFGAVLDVVPVGVDVVPAVPVPVVGVVALIEPVEDVPVVPGLFTTLVEEPPASLELGPPESAAGWLVSGAVARGWWATAVRAGAGGTATAGSGVTGAAVS